MSMGILRAHLQGTKVALFLLFALSIATIMTISSPRPASAEGPLLGTVRCLVRTVFLTDCRPAETSPQTNTPTPSSDGASGQTSSNPQTQAGSTQSGAGRSSSGAPKAYSAPLEKPIVAPIEAVSIPQSAQPTTVRTSSYANMSDAEYLAYFNKYSKYAVAGAQQEAAVAAPVERTGEGWRFFGIAWYWWGAAVLLLATVFLSVRHKVLRKSSVLPVAL